MELKTSCHNEGGGEEGGRLTVVCLFCLEWEVRKDAASSLIGYHDKD